MTPLQIRRGRREKMDGADAKAEILQGLDKFRSEFLWIDPADAEERKNEGIGELASLQILRIEHELIHDEKVKQAFRSAETVLEDAVSRATGRFLHL